MPVAPALAISPTVDDLAGVVAAGPGHHRHAAGGGLDDELDDAASVRARRASGSRRWCRRGRVHPRHLAPGEARNRGLVEGAVARERGDERGAAPRERRSHGRISRTSRIVNQPRRPRPARGDEGPCANVARSRTVWVRVMVSAGPSKPTVWMPGTKPTRVEATSIGRGKPPRSSAPLSSSAVPDGASFLAAWWVSWTKAP